ncbi:MAG: hypothetical protein IPK93_07120 [Solirubrobacterales bacterium]|nr:hypothetical protein [Solirubrobacterales bacterium]
MENCGAGAKRSKRRRALWLIVLVAFFAGLAVPAEASTLKITGSNVKYDAVAGETNQLAITGNGTDFVFTESGPVAIATTPPCVNLLASVASCPAVGIDRIDAGLGDMNDVASYDASVGSIDVMGLDGGDGNDVLSGTGPTDGQLLGRDGNDVATGGDGDDDIRTGDGIDVVTAGSGDDYLRAGLGADTVNAGPGDDRFSEESAPDAGDVLDGGAGLGDSIDLRDRTGPLNISLNGVADDGEPGEADNVIGIERIDSGDGNDTLTGGPEPNSFLSNDGDDVLNGGPGPDYLYGNNGDDELNGARAAIRSSAATAVTS